MSARASASGWAEHATRALADAGYRRGSARRAVVELFERDGCALSALEIEQRLRAGSEREVSRASIYRVLEQLQELGLIALVQLGDGLSRYEAVQPDGHHHHHLVCDRCGTLVPFSDPALERVLHRIAKTGGFELAEHDVTLHGICETCRTPRRRRTARRAIPATA